MNLEVIAFGIQASAYLAMRTHGAFMHHLTACFQDMGFGSMKVFDAEDEHDAARARRCLFGAADGEIEFSGL